MFVQASNLNFYRGNLCKNKLASYSTFLHTILFAPFFYFAGSIIMLRSKDNQSSKICEIDDISCAGKPYSWLNCYIYDVCAWNVGYMIGLHFTFTKFLNLKGFNLRPDRMREWPAKNWVFFWVNIAFAVSFTIYLVICYIEADLWIIYLVAMILLLTLVFLPAYLFRKTHCLHFHHYNLGMLWVFLIGY